MWIYRHDSDHAWAIRALFPDRDSMDQYRKWYHDNITQKISERSWTYAGVPGRYVDIVNDVVNVVAVHWVSEKIVCIILTHLCVPKTDYAITSAEFL